MQEKLENILSMEKNDLLQEVKSIIEYLKKCTLPSGAIALRRINGNVSREHTLPDLGDIVPFLLYFGENEFAKQQIVAYEKSLKGEYLVSEFSSAGIRGLVKSYEYSDLILGLRHYASVTKDSLAKRLLRNAADAYVRAFVGPLWYGSLYMPYTHVRLPVVDMRDGMMIEVFLDLDEDMPQSGYGLVADRIYEELFANRLYRRYGLLPSFALSKSFTGISFMIKSRHFTTAQIAKPNSNTLYGLLKYYQTTRRDDVKARWYALFQSVMRFASDSEGGITYTVNYGHPPKEASLTASLAFMELACDASVEFDDKDLVREARRLADFWIKRQGSTGLFPTSSVSRASFIDSETDMVVALMKVYERTGDSRYLDAARRCFFGLRTYHILQEYPYSVDIETGATINTMQKMKFIALALKSYIVWLAYAEHKQIYKNSELFDLIKDR